jgi:ribosome maturation factor RimP
MSIALENIDKMVEPVIASMNLIYWGAVLVSEDGQAILRIYVDKEGGVSIDDCAAVSRSLSALFDVEEPLSCRYSLEVSSPGIDRQFLCLDHYKANIMHNILVRLHEAVDKKRSLAGILTAVSDDGIVLLCDGNEYTIKFNQIKRTNLNS